MYLKTDEPNFVRDGSTRAVLNTDNSAYLAFKQQRNAANKTATLQQDIDTLKNEMQEIKSLLKKIIEREE